MGLVNKQTNTDNKIKLDCNVQFKCSDMELLKGNAITRKDG